MRWVHDLAAFDRLARDDQERVIGRTKTDSVELSAKPPSAHIRDNRNEAVDRPPQLEGSG